MISTIAGLPLRTAVLYSLFFTIALCSYGVLWPRAPIATPDSVGYLAVAQDLTDLTIDQLHGRAPGYPLFILLTGSSHAPSRPLFFASLLLHFASIWLLACVLRYSELSDRMLNTFGLLLVLPPYVEPAAYVLSESLCQLVLVTGVVSFASWYQQQKTEFIFISALAFAYAALTRPVYQMLPIFLTAYLLITQSLNWVRIKRRDVLLASTFLVFTSVIILGGYSLINYRRFGHLGVITPKLGLTLSTKTWRFFDRLPDEYSSIRTILVNTRNQALIGNDSSVDGSMSIWAAVPALSRVTGLSYSQLSEHMLKANLLLIKKTPLLYLQEVVFSFGSYWFPSSGPLANFNSRFMQLLWAILHFCLLASFALTMIILFGTYVYIQNSKRNLTILESLQSHTIIYMVAGAVVFYTAAISCLIEVGSPRYRAPTESLIVFMIFLGAHIWRRLVTAARAV